MFAVAALAAAQSAPKPAAGPKPPAGVPTNATMVDEITWRAVDSQGKAWMYKQTPFGMMKSPELSTPEQQKRDGVGDKLAGMTVKEEGDTLKFSRPGPFGVYNWTKKKNDLNEDEKAVWERSQKAKTSTTAAKE
jgi:hypothetical protein